MLLGEGFNKYVLCGKYCRYCILFTIVGFEGRRWIGRGVKGSARFVDQMMSFSPLCPSREVKGFALRWNLLHIKLYSFYREHCCCLCPSLSFALPFTFKSNFMGIFCLQLFQNDRILFTDGVPPSMQRVKQRY